MGLIIVDKWAQILIEANWFHGKMKKTGVMNSRPSHDTF